ncbi:MAG: hypothetical protein JSU58_06215 [Dehalococcoidales bacterium]|nr:MAG: hypothetical protein JSU58_06215 [Dehalococcoidales bacterium]
MKKRNKVIRLITLAISVILLVSLLGTGGTAFADGDDDTVYYDVKGNKLEDPCGFKGKCYIYSENSSDNTTENLTSVECPKCTKKNDDSGEKKRIPPGQMVRRGLTGYVVGVNVTDGYYYFLVETNFGIIVKVCTNQTTNQTVNATMIGKRVAVKLEKVEGGASEYAQNGTDNRTDNVTGAYREANAIQFRLIPSKGGMKHKWGTVGPLGQGCIFEDEDGNQIPAACGNSSGNVIGLVGGSGNGTGGNGTAMLIQTQQMSRILNRIEQRIQQAEDEGDEVTLAWLQWKYKKFEAKQLRLEEQKAARAQKANKKGKNKD